MGRNNLAGAWGEAVAAAYLQRKHYRIVASGYRCRYGEIDLIAQYKGFLIFVEVKLRKSDSFAKAYEYVDAGKQQRLRITASLYLSQYPTQLQPRFDVIEVYAPEGTATRHPVIHHMEGAFE